jgi:hypothetical protein
MWEWLEESFPQDNNFLLMGDFNLTPRNPAFRPLLEQAHPVIRQGATTLSSIDGRYANLYDNILVGRSSSMEISEAGIDRYPEILGWSHKEARRHVSDHAPVYITIRSTGPFQRKSTVKSQISSASRPAGKVSKSSIRGNRNSQIYHHPGCPGFDQIAPHNRVEFAYEHRAQESEYRRARNCSWPAPAK